MRSQSSTYQSNSALSVITGKVSQYVVLAKLRLSSLVVFSAVMAYLFEGVAYSWLSLLMLSIGGILVTSSANTINQILEKDSDKLMTRTSLRPLPTGNLTVLEATLFAGLTALVGIGILSYFFNPLSGLLGALSLIIYAFLYTPFKKVSPAAVFIGAIPGALPLLIGSTAASGQITASGILLFSVQFLWQMPHFWAIAWILNDDYAKAGFSLLPSNSGKTREAALQNIPYLLLLLLTGVVGYYAGLIGTAGLLISLISCFFFLTAGIQLCVDLSDKSAKKLMFASFFYIPIVLIAFVVDKI